MKTVIHNEDSNIYINRAIEMLKEDYKDNGFTAGYNGIVCLLGYAKHSHEQALENKDKEIELLEAREVAWGNKVSQLNEEIAERNKVIFDLCDQIDGHLKEIERLKKEIEDKAVYTGNSLK